MVGWAEYVVHMDVMGSARKILLRELEVRGH